MPHLWSEARNPSQENSQGGGGKNQQAQGPAVLEFFQRIFHLGSHSPPPPPPALHSSPASANSSPDIYSRRPRNLHPRQEASESQVSRGTAPLSVLGITPTRTWTPPVKTRRKGAHREGAPKKPAGSCPPLMLRTGNPTGIPPPVPRRFPGSSPDAAPPSPLRDHSNSKGPGLSPQALPENGGAAPGSPLPRRVTEAGCRLHPTVPLRLHGLDAVQADLWLVTILFQGDFFKNRSRGVEVEPCLDPSSASRLPGIGFLSSPVQGPRTTGASSTPLKLEGPRGRRAALGARAGQSAPLRGGAGWGGTQPLALPPGSVLDSLVPGI